MPKYAEPESSPELRDAISKLISASGLSEAEASRKLGYSAPSQLNRRLNEGKPAFTRDEIERICDEFTLGPEQRVELLRLRGDVVIVQPGQSVQVVAIEQLHAALTMLLSQTLRTELEPLLALLTDALRGVIPWAMLRERAAQAPQVAFDHAQMGDVSIGAVAGRDVITIGTLQLLLPPPSSPPPPQKATATAGRTTEAPNPFGRRGRIDDPAEFFGREELLRRIFEELGKGSNLSLIGEREIGKSSLLCMIQRQGAARLGLAAEALLHIDMQVVHSEDDFFEALCAELGLEACRGYRLARQLRGKHFILCLDEIEKMRRDRFSADVRDELRGLADGAKAPLTLVIASNLPLGELFPDKLGEVSPLANICSPLEVPPFTRAEARAFLAARLEGTGVSFSEDETADLLEQSGRRPAHLQQVAAALYRQKTGA